MAYFWEETRLIKTNLPDTDVNRDILNSVIGQMSDGIWEESSYMKPYWENADIKGVDIEVKKYSVYSSKSDEQILDFFAKKVYTIARMNIEDEYAESVRDRIYAEHGEKYQWLVQRNEGETEEEFRKRCNTYEEWSKQAKEEVNNNPINFKKVFNESNEDYCSYLDCATVGDAFKVYKGLKDRMKEILNIRTLSNMVNELSANEKTEYRKDGCVFVFEKDSEYDPNYVDDFGDKGEYNNIVNVLFYPSEEAYENHSLGGFSGDIHLNDIDFNDLFAIEDNEGNGTFREIADNCKDETEKEEDDYDLDR